MITVTTAVCWLCLIPGFFSPGPALSEEEPTISLVKTIIVRDYKGLKVSSDVYVVRPDDYLTRILRDRGVIDQLILDRETRDLILALNPKLKNPNLIFPGQKLILPVGPVEDLRGVSDRAAVADKEERPSYTIRRVQKGEMLVQFLQQAGIPDKEIYDEYLKRCLELNPEIKNPNLIYPGQSIKIPLFGTAGKETAAVQTAPQQEKTEKPKPQPAPQAVKAPEDDLEAKETVKTPPPPPVPDDQTLATRTALGLIFTRMGEEFLSTGQHFLPLKAGGQITLNAAPFPIIKLRNGHRIILDLEKRLPEQMARLIRETYPDYSIFQAGSERELKNILIPLFKECNYHQINEKGSAFFFQEIVKVKLAADWVIFPQEKDLQDKRPVLLNLPASRSEGTFPEAAAFLREYGVTVIDFYPQGNIIGPELAFKVEPSEDLIKNITSAGLIEFLKALLDILDQKYSADLTIPVTNSSTKDKDYDLSVNARIYFHRNGTDYLVRTQKLPDDIAALLKAQGAEAITIRPEEGALAAARTLSNILGLNPKSDFVLKGSTRPDDRNIEFTLPGLTLRPEDGPLFLTSADIPAPLVSLLDREKVKVVKFIVNNP